MRLHHYIGTILFLIFSTSNAQETIKNDVFTFLDSLSNVKLKDKTEVRENIGSFVEHSTIGEVEFQKIINDSSISIENKSKLLESVLLNNSFYHLHKLAGNVIQSSYSLKLNHRNSTKSDYLKLRTIITIEDEIFHGGGNFFELKSEKIEEILQIIANPEANDISKKYFIEVLYSLTSKPETGKLIFERISKLSINDSIKQYNSQLQKYFELYKPNYEHLESIRTWKEMDRNKDQLEKLFMSNQPIMFFQILSQNPSTVLESKKLSNLKNDALLFIIKYSKPTSFFHDLRIFYLVQFLIEGNYSIRFLDTIMNEHERKQYLGKLETQ